MIDARDQAQARAKEMRATVNPHAPAEPLAKSLDAFAEELGRQAGSIANQRQESISGIAGEMKLREMAGELYGDVSRYGGRPTQSQLDRAGVLEQEVEELNSAFEALLAKSLDSLNARLRAAGSTPITRLSEEAFKKRER